MSQEAFAELLLYLEGDDEMGSEFRRELEECISYECYVCRRHQEDMLCCNFCDCNVCPKCAVEPAEDEVYCSSKCLCNFLDDMLYTCSQCENEDVLGSDVFVCLTCENRVCVLCVLKDERACFCSKVCIDAHRHPLQ